MRTWKRRQRSPTPLFWSCLLYTSFSLSVLDGEYRKTLNYLGTVSGRDENKVEKSGLTVEHEDGTPYFGEANTVLVCRKLYAQPYDPSCFIDKACDERW